MWNDRPAKHPVDVNGNIEEMDVQLSVRELRAVLHPETAESLLSGRFVIEPWIRITDGADLEIAAGVDVSPDEDTA